MDTDRGKIDLLEGGKMPIYEPGLLELVQRNRREGRLTFTTELARALHKAEFIFIAVGTPQGADGAADLTNLWRLADALAAHLEPAQLLVIKSTVPVGTNRALVERLAARLKRSVEVASN